LIQNKVGANVISILKFLAICLLVLIACFAIAIANNNFGSTSELTEEIDESFEKAIVWMEGHRELILKDHNPMLWRFVSKAADISDDPRLKDFIDQYRRENQFRFRKSPWYYLYFGAHNGINPSDFLGEPWPPYFLHFLYGYTCDTTLGDTYQIQKMNQPLFCIKHQLLSPACITHQIVAFRLMQETGCLEPAHVTRLIDEVSFFLKLQMLLDFRVVDVYLQRVLVMLDTNQHHRIRDRWIHRILKAQLADGGWADFSPVLSVGDNNYIGFTANNIAIASPRASFHATAQGLLVMTHLRQTYGKANFTDVTQDIVPGISAGRSWSMGKGDIDGDGKTDVLIGGWGTQARLLLSNISAYYKSLPRFKQLKAPNKSN